MAGSEQDPQGRVRRLTAVGVAVPSPETTAANLHDLLDFVVIPGEGGAQHLTCEGEYGMGVPRRILTLRPGTETGLSDLTFEVNDAASLDALGVRLEAAGVAASPIPADAEGERGLRFTDPAGTTLSCRLGGAWLEEPLPPSDVRPRRLGHVNLNLPNLEAVVAFYTDVLGMRLSEQVGDILYFLRATSDHHNMGLRTGAPRPTIHHVAFEIRGWDAFKTLCDHVMQRGHKVEYGPGRHGPGNNLFVYLVEPHSGLRIECFAEMAHVADEEAYVPPKWESLDRVRTVNRWGPQPPQSFLG